MKLKGQRNVCLHRRPGFTQSAFDPPEFGFVIVNFNHRALERLEALGSTQDRAALRSPANLSSLEGHPLSGRSIRTFRGLDPMLNLSQILIRTPLTLSIRCTRGNWNDQQRQHLFLTFDRCRIIGKDHCILVDRRQETQQYLLTRQRLVGERNALKDRTVRECGQPVHFVGNHRWSLSEKSVNRDANHAPT